MRGWMLGTWIQTYVTVSRIHLHCCAPLFISLLDKVYPRCWLRLGGLPVVIVVVVVASRCLSPSTTRSPWLVGGNKNTCKLNEGTHELTSRVRV